MTNEQVLNCPMSFGPAQIETVHDFFVLSMLALWDEGDSFSGKRPLGNSGWYTDIILSLAAEGFIELHGSEGDYWVSDDDEELAFKAVDSALQSLLAE